jgi:hypothetical protein
MTMTETSREKTMPADPAIQPFRIDIPQADLDDLKARLVLRAHPGQGMERAPHRAGVG